jgi:hypothetical protein
VQATLHFQPFELNPDMPPGGEDVNEHLARKYGGTPEQFEANRAAIRERGAAVGFEFNPAGRGRIYNTFNAHRLLHWAGQQGDEQQLALKRALLEAYHGRGEAVEQDDVLLAAVEKAGWTRRGRATILDSDEFAAEVREAERLLPAGRHPLGAGGGHQRPPPHQRRPAARGVRAGAASRSRSREVRTQHRIDVKTGVQLGVGLRQKNVGVQRRCHDDAASLPFSTTQGCLIREQLMIRQGAPCPDTGS